MVFLPYLWKQLLHSLFPLEAAHPIATLLMLLALSYFPLDKKREEITRIPKNPKTLFLELPNQNVIVDFSLKCFGCHLSTMTDYESILTLILPYCGCWASFFLSIIVKDFFYQTYIISIVPALDHARHDRSSKQEIHTGSRKILIYIKN